MWKPPSYWSKVSPQQPASYIIYKDGLGYVYAKNGETGKIDFRDTDAATVIQSAIDALTSGRIIIREGSYIINSSITISSKSKISIIGIGRPTLKAAETSGLKLITIDGSEKIEIAGLVLTDHRAEGGTSAENAIRITNSSDIIIHHNEISGFWSWAVVIGTKSYDISDAPCYRVYFYDNYVHDCGKDGIHVVGSQDVYIIANIFDSTGDDSIALCSHSGGTQTKNVYVMFNIIKNVGYANGIKIHSGYQDKVEPSSENVIDVYIVNNIIEEPNKNGIIIIEEHSTISAPDFAKRVHIVGNKIIKSEKTEHGIYLLGGGQEVFIYGNEVSGFLTGVNVAGSPGVGNYSQIIKNHVYGTGSYSISIAPSDPGSEHINVLLNTVRNSDSRGINIVRVTSVIVKGNCVDNVYSHGIHLYGLTDVVVEGNIVRNFSTVSLSDLTKHNAGIHVGSCTRVTIVANAIYYGGGSGINTDGSNIVNVVGNVVYNIGYSGQETQTYRLSGIQVANGQYCLVENNITVDDRDTAVMARGITVYNITTGFHSSNMVYGAWEADIKIAGTVTLTKNSGKATITAGSTSVTVNHGLASKPSKVQVTPLSDPGAYWYVTNRTDTSFDIVLSTAPTSDVTFAWQAEV